MLLIRDRRWTLGVLAFVAPLAGVALVVAGPLNPPSGAVTSTYKTLAEVEPRIAINSTNTPGDADSVFRIRQPGSYYLTGNVTGASGKMGIEIDASYVTLDLNGYVVQGAVGALDGISCTLASATGITVMNGTVRGWPSDGVDCSTAIIYGGRIEGVTSVSNGARGIAAGNGFVLINCTASANTGVGIDLFAGCTVSNCSSRGNASDGFDASSSCTLTGCSAFLNGGIGFDTASDGCAFMNCAADDNTGDGYYITVGGIASNCTATYNQGNGYSLGVRCKLIDSNAYANGTSASGANIRVNSIDNHVVGNSCSGATRGFQVTGSGNFIARNVCSGSTTNWDIAAGNTCLVVNAATNAGAWSGNSGGTAPGSTDPNANFTY